MQHSPQMLHQDLFLACGKTAQYLGWQIGFILTSMGPPHTARKRAPVRSTIGLAQICNWVRILGKSVSDPCFFTNALAWHVDRQPNTCVD